VRVNVVRGSLCSSTLVSWIALALFAGCGLPLSNTSFENAPTITDGRERQPTADVPAASMPLKLPFQGCLVEGNRDELPTIVANALVQHSAVTFAYREQLTHDEYHIPLIVAAFDPVTWVGAPLGDFGVTSFATLTIRKGDEVLGDYTAKAFVSRPYSLYSSPTHRELEAAARAAVRAKIDAQLARDANRLGQEAGMAVAEHSAP